MIDAAILLAAGLGTRLAPLSHVRAKAALPVAGTPIIRRQLAWLAAAGVRRVVVNLHHLPATITGLVGHGVDLGLDVRYSWEPLVLGSGGGPRRAFDLLDAERAFVVNGDTLTDLDLGALAAGHDRHRPLVTLASTPEARAGYNALAVDALGRFAGVTRAGVAPAPHVAGFRHVHFIGVQVVERRAFAAVSPDQPCETLTHVYPGLCADEPGAVRVHAASVVFHDIGTPADYLSTVRTLAAAEGRALDRGRRAHVDATAAVHDSVLWDDVTVGPRARVRGSVLADGVVLPPGIAIADAAVVPRHLVPAGVRGHAHGDLWIAPLDPAG